MECGGRNFDSVTAAEGGDGIRRVLGKVAEAPGAQRRVRELLDFVTRSFWFGAWGFQMP